MLDALLFLDDNNGLVNIGLMFKKSLLILSIGIFKSVYFFFALLFLVFKTKEFVD